MNLKEIKKIWKNKQQILEGIKNNLFKKEFVEGVVELRKTKCNSSCKHFDEKGTSCIVPGTQPCCNLCGCSLGWKLRSMSSECDAGKWHAVLTEEEEENLENGKS